MHVKFSKKHYTAVYLNEVKNILCQNIKSQQLKSLLSPITIMCFKKIHTF